MSKVQMLLKHPDFVKTVGYSATEVIDTFHLPKKAVEMLTPYWIYVGNRMDDLPFTIYAFLMADYFTGSYVCRGFSHEMSMKLQRKVEENGAQFEFRQEVEKILTLAQVNVNNCFQAVLRVDTSAEKEIAEVEDKIDCLNKDIAQYISKILVNNKSGDDVAAIEEYMLISGNAERIGDHAQNIADYVATISAKAISFSESALDEIRQMQEITDKALSRILTPAADKVQRLSEVSALEQRIDDMTDTYRETHLQRMKDGICSEEGCILYSELLTDFERIGDHVLNIAEAYAKMELHA